MHVVSCNESCIPLGVRTEWTFFLIFRNDCRSSSSIWDGFWEAWKIENKINITKLFRKVAKRPTLIPFYISRLVGTSGYTDERNASSSDTWFRPSVCLQRKTTEMRLLQNPDCHARVTLRNTSVTKSETVASKSTTATCRRATCQSGSAGRLFRILENTSIYLGRCVIVRTTAKTIGTRQLFTRPGSRLSTLPNFNRSPFIGLDDDSSWQDGIESDI